MAVASVTDAAIHKQIFGSNTSPSHSAKWATLIISNEEMNDIIQTVTSWRNWFIYKRR